MIKKLNMEYEMLDSRSKSLTNKSSRRTVLYTQKEKAPVPLWDEITVLICK